MQVILLLKDATPRNNAGYVCYCSGPSYTYISCPVDSLLEIRTTQFALGPSHAREVLPLHAVVKWPFWEWCVLKQFAILYVLSTFYDLEA